MICFIIIYFGLFSIVIRKLGYICLTKILSEILICNETNCTCLEICLCLLVHFKPPSPLLSPPPPGLESLRDSAHSTPVRFSDHVDILTPRGSREMVFSDEEYTPCRSILPTPVCESNLDLSIGQQVNGTTCATKDEESELAAAPAIPDTESPPPALPGPEGSVPREPEPEQENTFLQSVLRLLAVTLCLLLALLLLLVVLAESDLELAFLRDIRLTPEFQQFHYQYFCPLRRWVSCKLHPITRLIDS